jgi:hypothetical protein
MLTIAGGIILAVVLIVTAGIWLPLLILAGFWAVIAIIGISALFLLIFVVPEYLPEGLVKFVEEYWVIAFLLGFTFGGPYMFVLLGNDAIKDRKVFAGYFLKAMGVICLSLGLFYLFGIFDCGLDSVNCGWTTEKTIFLILITSCLYIFYAQDTKSTATDTLEQLTDEENISILGEIDQIKKKEITRLKDDKKKAEEKNRKENELMAERFLIIKKTLQELKIAYAKDEDIDIAVSELSACLTLGKFSSYSQKKINIYTNRNDDGFHINYGDDYPYDFNEYNENYNCSEKVIDYIVEQVGKFFAERDSE